MNHNLEKGHTIPLLDHGFVRYIDHMGDDMRIIQAARTSYGGKSKGPEQDKKLLNSLWKRRHTTPFEQVQITLEVKLPIFIMRHLQRHRMQSINEISARYTELPEEFYIPKEWRKQATKNKQSSDIVIGWNPWHHPDPEDPDQVGSYIMGDMKATGALERHCVRSYYFYKQLLAEGVAKEMARMVLPVNIYTQAYTTWDLKNLLHFVTLRDDPGHAQWEIEQYAKAIKLILEVLFPWTMEAYDRYKFLLVDTIQKPQETSPSQQVQQ